MADNVNVKVIVVDHIDLNSIMATFSELVHDKLYKSIPYKDYTKLKKYNKEVELRFYPSDGAVLAVPVEEGCGLLWWGKKTDDSFGSFLWGHFQEELKEMNEKDKKIQYDIFGELASAKADNTCATCAVTGDGIAYTTAGSGWGESCTAKSVSFATPTIHADIHTVTDDIREVKEQLDELKQCLDTKINMVECDYSVKDSEDRVLSYVDDVHYDVRVLADKVSLMEDKLEKHLADNKTKIAMCDVNGIPHEVEATLATQSTSSKCYPVKGYAIKADYMSSCDNRKEKKNMDTNKMFNGFEFGPVDDRIKMSPYGMAIRNADGRYVSYDVKSANIVDVEVFNFDNHNLIYKMPVAVSAIAVGDTVIHMKKPMFVTNTHNGVITVIDIYNGELKTIMPATNMFGFNFVTKVVSLFNFTGANAPSAENPFGNILPFMLMGEDKDFKDILPLMLMTGNTGMLGNMSQNSLLWFAMMNDKGNVNDMLPLLLVMGNNPFAPAAPAQHQCHCGQHNGENH